MNPTIGKIAYGGTFTLLLPLLLTMWGWRLDQSAMDFWSLPFKPWVGIPLLGTGLGLMAISMHALWRLGHGLPMNAFPPTRLVTGSSYALVSHPIYVGFVLAAIGTSLLAESPAGFWVVCPVTALAAIALVAGFEGPRLRDRFGPPASIEALIGVPPSNLANPGWPKRLVIASTGLAPWAVTFSILSTMPDPAGASNLRMPWEMQLPTWGWMIWVYSAAYPMVIAAPLLLRTNAELRRFVLGAWMATISGFLIILTLPGKASILPLAIGSQWQWLVDANRALDADWLSFPSFHAIWIVFASYCFRARIPRLGPLWTMIAILVCLSCLLTGSHAVADVIAGAGLGVLCWHYQQVWQYLVSAAEAIANSWAATQIGPVRIINHAIWSGLAAALGILLVRMLVGSDFQAEITFVFLAGLFAAGAWGYWLEGGHRLARPFGYFGYLFGSLAAFLTIALVNPNKAFLLAAAFAVAAPLAQAIGRIRCLVQGCCHGRPVTRALGFRVTHPNSRVTALSGYREIAIHPTQLYSILGNLIVFAILWRTWHIGAAPAFICSLYLVLSSLLRFIEEQFRGEVQTPSKSGLSIYQWLSVFLYIVGILLGMLHSQPILPRAIELGLVDWLLPIGAGLTAAIFMSVDFPNASWRFSRLTVNSAIDSSVCTKQSPNR